MMCYMCGCTRFITAEFRIRDILLLLILRYPVQCMRCGQRNSMSIFWIRNARDGKSGQ